MSKTSSPTFGIRGLAERTGVSAHTLRYYEGAGLMIDVPRDGRGHRRYTEDHVRWVAFLVRLRESGMGISQIRSYAAFTRGRADPSGEKRLALLREHRDAVRAKVARLGEHLEVLERKVAAGCGPLITSSDKR